ncbi:hypothetical protein [Mucilaginibacter gracilis]|uniref:hypothetical protein n=1 Tax=Mucilaginibacter gracilis TaxID=423350 RepID=UPI0011C4287B|nr:hypothetical protein [Mucilaginibacter gracilis]
MEKLLQKEINKAGGAGRIVVNIDALLFKRKKEAKKEKRVRMWITLRVTHILTRQARHNKIVLAVILKELQTTNV